MPHLTLEYSANLGEVHASDLLLKLNQSLMLSGEFNEIDIKSRALRFDQVCVGTAPAQRGFVHVKLAILAGRSLPVRQALSAGLLEVLKQNLRLDAALDTQICVEVQEIERDSYSKHHYVLSQN